MRTTRSEPRYVPLWREFPTEEPNPNIAEIPFFFCVVMLRRYVFFHRVTIPFPSPEEMFYCRLAEELLEPGASVNTPTVIVACILDWELDPSQRHCPLWQKKIGVEPQKIYSYRIVAYTLIWEAWSSQKHCLIKAKKVWEASENIRLQVW